VVHINENQWVKKMNLPSISIVTPSLNQGHFIEATIQSVLAQNYPHLEYIVADGGSTDNTLAVLEKYSGQIRWYSKKDKGQTDAINNALKLANGDILAYLNTDDVLLPGALLQVGSLFALHEDTGWLTGRCRIIDEAGNDIRRPISMYKNLLLYARSYHLLLMTNYISQPSTFWRKSLLEQYGLFDASLHYIMDYEYWLRLWKVTPPLIVHRNLAGFRIQSASKTTSTGHLVQYINEEREIIARHTRSRFWRFAHDAHRVLMTRAYAFVNG
jgi:glycosyltransferase involved in cell wall biosynthesis